MSAMAFILSKFYLLQGIFTRSASKYTSLNTEPKKIVVFQSTWKALDRCKIHLPPVIISIAILVLNVRGTYIGADVSGPIRSETITLMLFQIVAKAHEVLIIGSTGLIILHVVQHELIHGDGLPLGLIGSGLSFGSLIYFFTGEFWGAARYVRRPGRRGRRIGFVIFLLVAGTLAFLAGPSSATLLVPKSQVWPSGGTRFFLNATKEQLWPADLSDNVSQLQIYCSNLSAAITNNAICPSGGFNSLREHWSTMNHTNFYHRDVPVYAKKLSGSRFYWPVHSSASAIPPRYALGDPRFEQPPKFATYLVQPHAAAAVILQRIATDWWGALTASMGTRDDLIDDRNIKASVPSAIASVRCAAAQNLSASDTSITFPRIEGRFDYAEPLDFVVNHLNNTPVDHLRFSWVHLPEEFGPVSIGGIFEAPWESRTDSRLVIGCTAQAGWVPTTVYTNEYSFWTGWYPWGIDFGGRTPSWAATPPGQAQSPTNGRIALGDTWLGLLTPLSPSIAMSQEGWQPNTLEDILEVAGLSNVNTADSSPLSERWNQDDVAGQGRTAFLEAIICSVLVDGLSRTGSQYAFDEGNPISGASLALYELLPEFRRLILAGKDAIKQPGLPASQFTVLKVQMEITGYALKLSIAGYLSVAVLVVHIAIALAHTVWTVVRGRTSESWNSVSEWIALSQNSPPAPLSLSNTGGGITCSVTYGQMARIQVRRNSKGDDEDEHVEMVFDQKTLRTPWTWPGLPGDTPLRAQSGSALLEPATGHQARVRRDFKRPRANHAYS